MNDEERAFMLGVVKYCKPKRILELGVQAGGGSLALLETIKGEDAHLYSNVIVLDEYDPWQHRNLMFDLYKDE